MIGRYSLCFGRLAVFALLCQLPGVHAAPPNILKGVGIDQKLGERVPLETSFVDEAGRPVTLADYFHPDRPVILVLAYYRCPMLCNQVLNGLTHALRQVPFVMGKDFETVVVSIDPKETPELAAAKKQHYLEELDRPGASDGWHFLTGQQENIDRLANAVGYRYVYDEKTGQYAHGSGIMLVAPDGTLSRYFLGISYPSKDVRFGLMDASQGKIGSLADRVMLYCYVYDPTTGHYSPIIMTVLQVLAGLFTIGLGAFIAIMLRREQRMLKSAEPPAAILGDAGESC